MRTTSILYLSYDGMTDPLGQSQVLPYLAGLAKGHYHFTIISFEKPNAFKERASDIKLFCNQNKINWKPLTYHKNPPLLSTLYDIWNLWNAVKIEYRENQFEIAHCRSYITSLIGLLAKKKWNVKFIFDMRGFWADERVEGGLWNLNNPVFKLVYTFFKRKERQFLSEANYIISLTNNAKREIESWKLKSAPIMVIPTCVDTALFNPQTIGESDQLALRKKLGISGEDFVLLYLGSWGTWYLTENMIDFFSKLRRKNGNAKFLIVTGDQVNITNEDIKPDVIIVRAAREQVPLYISLASLAICFIKPSFSKKASSATKMGEILAMKVPIVTNEGWGDAKEFEKEGCLSVVNLLELTSEKIEEMISKKYQTHPMLDLLSLQTGIDHYSTVYESVLQKQ